MTFSAEFKRLRSLQNAKKTFAASRSVLKFRVLDLLECVPQRTGGEHLIVHIIGTDALHPFCHKCLISLSGPCITCLRLAKEGSDMHARVSRLITKGKFYHSLSFLSLFPGLTLLQHYASHELYHPSILLAPPRTWSFGKSCVGLLLNWGRESAAASSAAVSLSSSACCCHFLQVAGRPLPSDSSSQLHSSRYCAKSHWASAIQRACIRFSFLTEHSRSRCCSPL